MRRTSLCKQFMLVLKITLILSLVWFHFPENGDEIHIEKKSDHQQAIIRELDTPKICVDKPQLKQFNWDLWSKTLFPLQDQLQKQTWPHNLYGSSSKLHSNKRYPLCASKKIINSE